MKLDIAGLEDLLFIIYYFFHCLGLLKCCNYEHKAAHQPVFLSCWLRREAILLTDLHPSHRSTWESVQYRNFCIMATARRVDTECMNGEE